MPEASIFDGGNPSPCPAVFNAASYVLAQADHTPDKTALEVYEDAQAPVEIWTYAQLQQATLATAGGLIALGIQSGDRILLRIGNSSDFPLLFLAAITIGAIPVPTSTQLSEPELRSIVAELAPSLVCLGKGLQAPDGLDCPVLTDVEIRSLRDSPPAIAIECQPDDLAYIIYTSGTSGKPRAVMHAHRAIWARRMMWQGWSDISRADRMLHAGAFNWTYTLGTGLLDPWAVGATAMIYTGAPDRTIWAALCKAHQATIFAAAPGVLRQTLSMPTGSSFDSLRHALSAGEKLPQKTRDLWQSNTGKPVYEAYGMSEISTFVSASPSVPPKPGTTGRPQTGRRVAVINENGPVPVNTPGILAVSRQDQGLMLGYRNQPSETAAKFQGDWFVTGDTVQMDEAGYITHLGRDDDMMNAGGYRVSPLEVETVLLMLPQISEAACVELEVKADVTVIAAFYVALTEIDEKLLKAHCSARLARYKCPRAFRWLQVLPKGANNKIKRKELRKLKQP